MDGPANTKTEFLIEDLRPILSLHVEKGHLPFVQRLSNQVGYERPGKAATTKLRSSADRADFSKPMQLQPLPGHGNQPPVVGSDAEIPSHSNGFGQEWSRFSRGSEGQHFRHVAAPEFE